jgi:hypothetical protein
MAGTRACTDRLDEAHDDVSGADRMASTWDVLLEHEVASAIADEGRAVNNYWPTIQGPTAPSNNGQLLTRTADGDFRHNGLVYRSPVINISRHPLWGRIDEAFGEDPFLTSRMTVAFVKGTHGDDPRYLKLATTLKHYAVKQQEIGRRGLSASVSERMLMEYYLPHFKAGIMEGRDIVHVLLQPNQRRDQTRRTRCYCRRFFGTSGSSRDTWFPTAGRWKTLVRAYMKVRHDGGSDGSRNQERQRPRQQRVHSQHSGRARQRAADGEGH